MVCKSAVGSIVLLVVVAACLVGCGSGSGANTPATQSSGTSTIAVGSNTSNVPASSGGSPQPTFAFVPFNGGDGGYVTGYAVDTTTGALTTIGSFLSSPSPVAIAVHPSQRYLYVANGFVRAGGPPTITAFSVASNGILTPLPNSTITLEVAPTSQGLAMHPSGKFLYVATSTNYTGLTGGIECLTIDPNTGLLSQPVLRAANAAWQYPIAIDNKGKFLFTIQASSSNSSGSIAVYGISQSDGSLTLLSTAPYANPSFSYLASAGNDLYVPNGDGATNDITAFAVDPTTGALTAAGSWPGAPPLAVSPSGNLLFVAVVGGLGVYTIDPTSGALSPAGSPYAVVSQGSQFFSAVNLDPTGRFVYVGSNVLAWAPALGQTMTDVSFVGWTIDPSSFTLTPMQGSPFPWGSYDPGVDGGVGGMVFVQPPQ